MIRLLGLITIFSEAVLKILLATSAILNPKDLVACVDSWPIHKDIETLIHYDGMDYHNIFSDVKFKRTPDYLLAAEPPEHFGVAGSWNRIMRFAFDDKAFDYLIVINSDAVMNSALLAKTMQMIEGKTDFCTIAYQALTYWVMSRKCYDSIGLFDENFYPAYYEDADYLKRIQLSDIQRDEIRNGFILHKSSSSGKAPGYEMKSRLLMDINKKLYEKKWKCYDVYNGYRNPFNDTTLSIRDWKRDEELHKKKHKIWNS